MDWKGAVAKVAPGIANMLGGPLAGMATTGLLDMFGIEAEAPDAQKQLEQAITKMTPGQAIEMKRLENDYAIELKKVDVDIFKAEVSDRKSARKEHKDSMTPAILTYTIVACAGFIIYCVMTRALPEGIDPTLVGAVVGYVFSELKQATGFWLGSSFGSRDRAQELSKTMAKKIK